MVIFHSYVSLPEGTWESHDMIPVAIHLSLDVWSTKTPRLTDLQPYLTWKKNLANKCSISNKSLAKMELLKHRSLYSLLLYNSSPGRSGAPWRWPIGIFRSLPKMLNFNINHPGHSNGKNTSKWLLDCQSIKISPWLSIFNFKSMVVIVGHRFPTISMPVARCSLPTQPLTQPRYLLITPHSLRSAANMFSLATFSITWVLGGIPKCLSQQTWSCRVPAGFALCAPYCGDCEVVFFALC